MKFVLGGMDTEMSEIEQLLTAHGYEWVYAQKNGQRVDRSQAYEADYPHHVPGDVWIECRPEGLSVAILYSLGIDVIDHHNPGDTGYHRPFSEYWEASSLGQLCIRLKLPVTERMRFIAAADHCLLGAYHGMCPGVDREAFYDFRMAFYDRVENPKAYLRDLYEQAIKCPVVEIGSSKVYDITELANYNRGWFADMACYYNIKTLNTLKKPNRTKYFVSNLSAKDIEYFMKTYVHELGDVIRVYGDPKRQFAAAVVSHANQD